MEMLVLVKTRFKGLVYYPVADVKARVAPGKPYVVNGHRKNLWGAFVPVHFA